MYLLQLNGIGTNHFILQKKEVNGIELSNKMRTQLDKKMSKTSVNNGEVPYYLLV